MMSTRYPRVSTVVVLSLVVLGLVAVPLRASATTVVPMTEVYDQVVNGDYVLAGNGVLACDQSKPYYSTGVSPACADFHGGVATTGGQLNINDRQWMRNVDADADPGTVNSSSASVTVPSGATVVKAVLYWSGNTGLVAGQTDVRCTSNVLTGFPATVAPAGTPDTQGVHLSVGATSTSVAPATFAKEASAQLNVGQPQYYSASADVTALLAGLPTGSAQTVTVGNVWAPQGYGCYGGWSIALVYDFGQYTPSIPASAAREVILYQGHVRKQSGEAAENVVFDGFTVQGPGTRAGFTLYEGDRSLTGDYARYTTTSSPTPTELLNPFGESNDVGVSVADGSVPYASFTGSTFTDGSVDAHSSALTNVTTGDTSITMSLGTTLDSYLLQNAILSVPTAAIRIDKSLDGALDTQTTLVGGQPTFTITVTNAGSVPLTGVTVSDALAPGCGRTLGTLPPPPSAASSVSYACTGSPVTTAFTNTATVTARTPLGASVDRTDDSRVEVASIALTKTPSSTVVPAGTPVTWTLTATNTGSVPLAHVAVDDPLVAACTRSELGTLAAGASASYTCSAVVSAGFTNTATTRGTTDGGLVPTATATAPVAVSRLEVTKTHTLPYAVPGQDVTFTLAVRNTGEVPLTAVTVTDTDAPACTRTLPGSLAAGASTSYTCTVPAAAADFTNHASATGTPPSGPAPTSQTQDVVDVRTPGVTIDKTTSTPVVAEGGTATFSITVTNSGATPLTDVTVTDGRTPDCARTIGALDVGGTTSFTCSVAGVAASFLNTATVTGTPPAGPVVTSDDSAAVQVAGVAITKTTATPVVALGGPVTFQVTVTNTGDVPLATAAVADPQLAACARADLGPIAPGASVTYACTDPSVEAAYTNSASVSATTTGGPTLTDSASARVDTSGVTLVKTAATPVVLRGDSGTYEITVTNTGSSPLTDVLVSDPAAPDCDRTIATLAAGTSQTFRCASPSLAQGQTNTASVSGTPPSGPVQKASDDAHIDVSSIRLEKAVDDTTTAPGDVVTFTLRVTNTGEVPLTGVSASDPSSPQCSRADLGTLAPAASTSWTCTTTAGASDLTNRATATGTPPSGPAPTSSAEVVVDVKTPGITITKTARDAVVRAGGDAVFDVVVTNTGAVDLADVHVADPSAGACERDYPTLAVGATVSYGCTVPHVVAGFTNVATVTADPVGGGTPVTDDDSAVVRVAGLQVVKDTSTPIVTSGSSAHYRITVANTGEVALDDVTLADPALPACATAIGTLAAGASVVVECDSAALTAGFANRATASGTAGDVTVDASAEARVQVSSISLAKTPSQTVAPVGSSITFSLTVVNTGEVTLGDVTVSDPTVPGCTQTVGGLAPGARAVVTCDATVPEAGLHNVASVSGTPPSGPKPTATADATVTPSGLLVLKSADRQTATPGSTVTWTITVVNTGQVVLDPVVVTDAATPSCDRPDLGALAVGASTAYECTATMTDGDLVNAARATGTPPSGPPPSSTGTATVDVRLPGIAVTKTADPVVVVSGGTATFTIVVTNTGETHLVDVTVADGLAPGCTRTFARLGVGEERVYSCALAGVTAGFTNTATATGIPDDGGTPVTDADTADVAVAALTLTKVTTTPVLLRGGTAHFALTVANPGEVDLTDVVVSDPSAPACTTTVGSLPAGVSRTIECDVADVTAGFTNTATASGRPPVGPALTATGAAAVAVAAVTITKTAPHPVVVAGSDATFTITVVNTGETALAPVTVDDPLAADCSRTLPSLAVGQTVTYGCTLPRLTRTVTNVATVTGVAGGVTPTDSDDAEVTVTPVSPPRGPVTPGVGSPGGGDQNGALPGTGAGGTALTLWLGIGLILVGGVGIGVRRRRRRF